MVMATRLGVRTLVMTQAKEEIVYRGKILAIVNVHQPNGEVWEIARRSPGVRVIIKNTYFRGDPSKSSMAPPKTLKTASPAHVSHFLIAV